MQKFRFALFALIGAGSLFAQAGRRPADAPFNQWSVEVMVGQNKPVRPFTEGYYVSNPERYMFFSEISHIDIGGRYMLSEHFGLKADIGLDRFRSVSGSGSLPFDSGSRRIGLQGVANIGRVLKFESFSGRLGLLAHAGVFISRFKSESAREDNGGWILGITPQVRITDRLAVNMDLSTLYSVRQHLTWDGRPADPTNNLTGMFSTVSVGATWYLGKKDRHADWYTGRK
jgi:OmpA-OmpF porin, OOP family